MAWPPPSSLLQGCDQHMSYGRALEVVHRVPAVAADLWPLIGRPPPDAGLWLVQRSWPDLRDIGRPVSRQTRREGEGCWSEIWGNRPRPNPKEVVQLGLGLTLKSQKIRISLIWKHIYIQIASRLIKYPYAIPKINTTISIRFIWEAISHLTTATACRYSWPEPLIVTIIHFA